MNDAVGVIELALAATLEAEPAEAKLRVAEKAQKVGAGNTAKSTATSTAKSTAKSTATSERERLRQAQQAGVLTIEEAGLITRRYDLRDKVIRVDDFSPDFSPAAHS